MGRIYTAQFNGVAVTAQQDLFEILCAATTIIQIHEIGLSQTTELGDAQEEQLLLLMKSGQTTTGSGGTTVTPVRQLILDTTSAATVKANNTTKATAGTIVTHYPLTWNVRIDKEKIWTPETRPVLAPSRRWTLELATTPADSITMNGYVVFEEIG